MNQWEEYRSMAAQDGRHNFEGFMYQLEQCFSDVDFRGKRVLEIGSGRGLVSLYAGLKGAARVVSMEPELDGSRNHVVETQRHRMEQLSLTNVEVLVEDFNVWTPSEKFDVLISFASINHLHESPHHALYHEATYKSFLAITRKMHLVLDSGGRAVITDACRYGLFSALRQYGVRRPWDWKVPSINWRIHQNPGVWKRLLQAGGFTTVEIHYPVPWRLRRLAPIASTSVVNFLLEADFILQCRA